MKDNTKKWFKAAGIRAVKTIAQSAIATIGTSAAFGDINWLAVGSFVTAYKYSRTAGSSVRKTKSA